jgi:hypothetical protein
MSSINAVVLFPASDIIYRYCAASFLTSSKLIANVSE